MNNRFRIGYRFQNQYEIIEILSKKTGFGIIYKVGRLWTPKSTVSSCETTEEAYYT